MEIMQIVGIGMLGVFAAVAVKDSRPELGMCISLAAGAVILAGLAPRIAYIVDALAEICEKNETVEEYFSVILRVTGIAYLTQLASALAKDAGEEAISKKLEISGKICAVALTVPVLENLIELIASVLGGF